MDSASNKRSTEDMKNAIMALDLNPIKFKLMDPEEGEGWSREEADHAEIQYKRFLLLTVTNEVPIVPTKMIDLVWHQHILDTRKYAEDCENAFGFFLHHFPYFGLRGEDDAKNLSASFAETCMLYEREFGEPYRKGQSVLGADCSSCGAGSCGGAGCVNSSCSGISLKSEGGRMTTMNVNVRPSLS